MDIRVLAVAACIAGPAPAIAESAFVLFEQAECLRDNAERYLELIDGPTFIFPGFCEEGIFAPTPEEVARATSQNAGYGSSTIVFDFDNQEGGEGSARLPANSKAAILVLTPVLMNCLRDRFDEVSRLHTPDIPGRGPTNIAELFLARC